MIAPRHAEAGPEAELSPGAVVPALRVSGFLGLKFRGYGSALGFQIF